MPIRDWIPNIPSTVTNHPADLSLSVIVNGQATQVPSGSTVRDLLVQMALADRPCAAEVNKVLVPKREHGTRTLEPGDRIELVSLVGGG
jgi:sulfur carrier protein